MLTPSPFIWLAEMKMLGRLRACDTETGLFKWSNSDIATSVSGEAVAVRAMNGTVVRARIPPSF